MYHERKTELLETRKIAALLILDPDHFKTLNDISKLDDILRLLRESGSGGQEPPAGCLSAMEPIP